jgi:hypothetical protein
MNFMTPTEPSKPLSAFAPERTKSGFLSMRSILLWLIGIPLPIILLLALCTHHF